MCLSAMLRLEIPHVNVLTKMDLVAKHDSQVEDEELDRYITPDIPTLVSELDKTTHKKFRCFNQLLLLLISVRKLNKAIGTLIDEFSMVNYIPLDISSEESISNVLAQVDLAFQVLLSKLYLK